jgi:hypothetical protein
MGAVVSCCCQRGSENDAVEGIEQEMVALVQEKKTLQQTRSGLQQAHASVMWIYMSIVLGTGVLVWSTAGDLGAIRAVTGNPFLFTVALLLFVSAPILLPSGHLLLHLSCLPVFCCRWQHMQGIACFGFALREALQDRTSGNWTGQTRFTESQRYVTPCSI